MIRAPVSSSVQQSIRALAGKLTRSPWRPLKPVPPRGAKPAEVGKGTPSGGEGGVAE